MKPIQMFVAGAVLAMAVTYFVVRPKGPEPVATATGVPLPATEVAPVAPPPEVSAPPPVEPKVVREAKPRRPAAVSGPKTEEKKPEPAAVAQSGQPAQPAAIPPVTPQSPSPVFTPAPVEEKKPEPRKPNTVTVPSGTLVTVRLDEKLSSATHQEGDSFRAVLDQALVVDGFVIAEKGARVEGRVAESGTGGRVKGKAGLTVELVRLTTADGQKLRLKTDSFAKQATGSMGKDAAKVGAAAGIGAAIGAIAGGGKGAAIGAAVGGAAGTGGVMATRGGAAELPSETRLSFRLSDAITVTERLK